MSAPDVTPPVERLHRVLLDEIEKRQPDYLDRPFTVAEIYQSLVPYRSHRDAIGVQMNGDYEDALLRLLAGAGDLVVLESDSALGEIRKELESRNPNTGLFREFPDASVRLNRSTSQVQAESAVSAPAPDEELTAQTQAAADTAEPEATSAPPLEAAPPTPVAELAPEPASAQPAGADVADPAVTFAGPPQDATTPASVDDHIESAPTTEVVGTPGPASFSVLPAPEPEPSSRPRYAERIASSFVDAEISPVSAAPAGASTAGASTAGASTGASTAGAPAMSASTTVRPPTAPAKPGVASEARGDRAKGGDAASCLWCADALPARDTVNFCPHCGKSTKTKPCGGCGDEMELAWRFCATCGSESTVGTS